MWLKFRDRQKKPIRLLLLLPAVVAFPLSVSVVSCVQLYMAYCFSAFWPRSSVIIPGLYKNYSTNRGYGLKSRGEQTQKKVSGLPSNLSVSISWDCHNKVPQTGWFQQQKLPHCSGGQKSKSKVSAGPQSL